MIASRIRTLTCGVGAGCALALLASASLWVSPAPSDVAGTALSAHPSQIQLACPAGIVDPFDTSNVAAATAWTSTSAAPVSPAPTLVTGEAGVIPSALSIAGQGGGELAGLSAVGCAAPRTSQWIATGATTSGADIVLLLSNPGPTASVVSVDGFGASGRLNTAPRQVTVPAGSTASVLLAGWFPDESALAVHVQADGGGVAAWAQASLMNGEIPQGTTLASASVPAPSHTILGIDPRGTSLLRLVSPSGDARVRVWVADSSGVHPLPGGEATVAEGTTLDMPLDGASNDSAPIALLVTADQDVVAHTTTITLGAPWAERASAWIMRANATPTTPLTEAAIPGRKQLQDAATSVLSSAPIRDTSLATESGVAAVRAHLLLYVPAQATGSTPRPPQPQSPAPQSGTPTQAPTPDIWSSPSPTQPQSDPAQDPQSSGTSASTPGAVAVRVGERTVYVAPGIPTLVEAPDAAGHILAQSPIHAAIVVSADTAVGTMSTTWNVGTEGISAVTGDIRLTN